MNHKNRRTIRALSSTIPGIVKAGKFALAFIFIFGNLSAVYAQNDTLAIRQIQEVPPGFDISPYVGQTVVTGGIISVNNGVFPGGYRFYLEQSGNGLFSGILAYSPTGQGLPNLAVGDSVTCTALVSDNGMTELDIVNLNLISPGYPEPTPEIITVSVIDSTGGSDSLAEGYEGVLTRISGLTVYSVIHYASTSKWLCQDSTGFCIINETSDSIEYAPQIGDIFDYIQGVIYQRNGYFELRPRYMRDLELRHTEIQSSGNDIPETFGLNQNYPNPFNVVTTIQYNIKKQANVSIAIFDVLGCRIAEFNEGIKLAGTYKIIWNAGNCVSGTYFYRIKADGFSETKKMLLIK